MKRRRTPVEYEFRTESLHREMTRSEAARLLTEEAEYGRWELARTRIGMGGSKTVWLRRRIIRIKHSA